MRIIPFSSFDRTILSNYPIAKRNQGQKKGSTSDLKDVICAFDIETTRLHDADDTTFMYIWQFCIGKEYCIYGRTWNEARLLFRWLSLECTDGERWLVFVHNLSYEFQFLRGLYSFTSDDVFCIKSRKILKAVANDSIEFRCSYLLSNMSLDEFTHKYNAPHAKVASTKSIDEEDDPNKFKFDYNKIRYPWTILSFDELRYCLNDVIGLVESIYILMETENDNIYSLPHTSTGYVRRDCKKAMQKIPASVVKDILPDATLYNLLREAFRGGNTHANRYFVKQIDGVTQQILTNVKSADRSSSYPDVLCNCKFPCSQFVRSTEQNMHLTHLIQDVNNEIPFLAVITIADLKLRDRFEPVPYLSYDKCRNIKEELNDNGRLLSANFIETTVTDVDFRIIYSMYDGIYKVLELYESKYEYLPKVLVETIEYYYIKKTELKDVPGQEIYYMKSKNKLNAIYGMMAQDPGKQRTLFMEGSKKSYEKEETEISDILDKSNRKAFLAYQWGVWTTAWARFRLQEGINLAGHNCIYVDTDSVKYIGEVDWSEFNSKRIADSIEHGAFAKDVNNVTHYMGVYEMEKPYKEFSTMGAKKYAFVQFDKKSGKDKLGITIAGVNKKKGGKELGDLKKFQEGFIFKEAGGVELRYNDYPSTVEKIIEGHKLEITPYVAILPSTYKLGLSADYERLLNALCCEDEDAELKL